MDKGLFIQAMTKFLGGVVLVGLLLFLSAGSLRYWQAWLLIGILFVPMLMAGLVMMGRNPDLLRKRLDAREKESEQKTVVALSGLLFIASFAVAGLSGIRCTWPRQSCSLLCRWFSHPPFLFSSCLDIFL
jgi:hypothetical protein